ncbi:MAG: UDP-N-acetylmuramoyl-L-alanine--D-glutamate ligase [Oscillospiraceae bacterium]|nr:UDP-N-acetylmuramoyl-L-alanine--D-glutamate ligase [Oscillospiraceae bacterium]
MKAKLQKFFDDIKGKKVIFIGAGVSHIDLIKLFAKKGAIVTVCDKGSRETLGKTADELTALGVSLVLGAGYLDNLNADIILRTPGMKYYTPELTEARKKGIVVTSEMELFFEFCPCPIFAVTGSDGKTTTTTLISEMHKAQGKTVHLGGNIGRALMPIIEEIKPTDVAVVELSSFQLISMRNAPMVSVVTNVTPNHLDMHRDMQEYIDAKRNIFLHQSAFSKTVLSADNEITAGFVDDVRGNCVMFSRKNKVERGAYLSSDRYLCYCDNGEVQKLFKAEDIKIPGEHNVENYLTAISAVWGYVDVENMQKVAKNFGGVEHRIELVREKDRVKWYNDSIATSPTRTIAGLLSFDKKLILLAGGYDKHIPYEPLAPLVLERVKTIILMGQTADKIETAIKNCDGYAESGIKIIRANGMEDAVNIANSVAKDGDIVSLSPASASFDMYKNFELRGRHFKELVNAL